MEIHWKSDKVERAVMTFVRDNEITAGRMISIKAAKNFSDLILPSKGRAKFLKGTLRNLFSVDLERTGNGKRLICEPVGNFHVKNGQFVKESITELRILRIEDYHH